jgi:hypothetical protein
VSKVESVLDFHPILPLSARDLRPVINVANGLHVEWNIVAILRNQDHGAGLPFRLAMEDVYFRNCNFIIFPTANGERLARAILESRPAKNVRTSQSFQKRFNALSQH